MKDRRTRIILMRFLIHCITLILMTSVKVTHGADCQNRVDLVIAVDTTSSQTSSSFDAAKAEVKGIVSGLTVGQTKTRLALISMSKQAAVVVNFNEVNSLSDFNAAVDRLTFSTDTVDLSEGIKVAKQSVLNTARADKISKVLILVKDRRSGSAAVSDTAVLSRVNSEAAAVKAMGAAINAVGIGGLWNRQELMALFGTDYLLFLNKDKALASVKSLNNLVCSVDCPNSGTSAVKVGLCYNSVNHVINTKTDLLRSSSGLDVCRKEISREFPSSCLNQQRCNTMDRTISACTAGKVTIENTWQSFDYRQQSCVTTKNVQTVDCSDSMKCADQVAEVIFLLDKSGSMGKNFPKVKRAAKVLISSLNIGPNSVRVGVITFSVGAKVEIPLTSTMDKYSLMRAVDDISNVLGSLTMTHLALALANKMLGEHARSEVAKFVFIITDGDSHYPDITLSEAALLKSAGATVYVIGIGNILESELRMMAAPESESNTVILKEFDQLDAWSREFSKKLCLELSAPHPRLCDGHAFVQSISECIYGKQLLARTQYAYSAANRCIKSINSTVRQGCRGKCVDPIDGNEHFQGDTWTNLCHEFQCEAAKMLGPKRTKCPAADGSCKDVGSPPFKCRDENGVEQDNCRCEKKDGKMSLVIELT